MPGPPRSLGSAAIPDPGPDDHLRGAGRVAIVYLDLACPRCAASWSEISALPLRFCIRHFPVASKRERAPALHAAAEAVALQSEPAFWEFWDSLLRDRAHVDDPHLWERVETLGLDLARFQADRRTDAVAARVRRDFESGIRAGVIETPAGFVDGTRCDGDLGPALARLAGAAARSRERPQRPHL
jgi:protein-disulfide isomerase